MPTGQFMVDRALIKLTLLNPGGSAGPSDSQTGIDELNEFWAASSIDEGLIYAVVPRRYALAYSAGYYRLGPSNAADWNGPIPSRIYKAYFLNVNNGAIGQQNLQDGGSAYAVGDTGYVGNCSGIPATYTINTVDAGGAVLTYTLNTAGTGYIPGSGVPTVNAGAQPGLGVGFTVTITNIPPSGQNRKEIKVVPMSQYLAHGDLGALALTPDEIAPDWTLDDDGFMRIHVWPIISLAPATIELEQAVAFSQWQLTVNYQIPFPIVDNITWALAARLISSFAEVVSTNTTELVLAEGAKAEIRLREYNRINRQLLPGQEQLPTQQAPTQA